MSSITDHPSDPLQFTKDRLSYNQNMADDRRSNTGIAGMQVRPASSSLTSRSQQRGQTFKRYQSRGISHPHYIQVGKSDYAPSAIMRKSSHPEAVRHYNPSHVRNTKGQQKVQGNGRYASPSLLTAKGHHSSYKQTNEPATAEPYSKPKSIKFFSLAHHTAPHVPSGSNSIDISLHRSNQEKLPSSVPSFSQELFSVSTETPKVLSYLFKHPQTPIGGHDKVKLVAAEGHGPVMAHKQRFSDASIYGGLPSSKKQSERDKPKTEHLVGLHQVHLNAKPLYHDANVAQLQTHSFNKYPLRAETQKSAHPAKRLESKYATGSQKFALSSLVNVTTRGKANVSKLERTTNSIYGFGGFKRPMWKVVKDPSNDSSGRYSFNKGGFKMANLYPMLSSKYSFGQRRATPEQREGTPTGYSSPSPDPFRTVMTSRPFTVGYKEVHLLVPKSGAGMDRDPNPGKFNVYKRIYGLKGFGTPPHEGAKPLIRMSAKSAQVQQGFEGFKPRSSEIWQPESVKIHRWDNKTEAGRNNESTMGELSSENLKPLLKTVGSTDADKRFTPDKYKKNRKIYSLLGFHPVTSKTQNKDQILATATLTKIKSIYLGPTEHLKDESRLNSETGPPSKTTPVEPRARLLSSPTRGIVRGEHVRGKNSTATSVTSSARNSPIVRLSKQPATLQAITYTDIVGSASFSGVRTTVQTPIILGNVTPTSKLKERLGIWTDNSEEAVRGGDNLSRGEGVFGSTEENKLGAEGEDADLSTSDLFLDNEGSGSLNTSLASHESLRGNLSELDYLRISTSNISFMSMKQSLIVE